MKVLHDASYKELSEIVKEDMARNTVLAREGKSGIDVLEQKGQ